MAQLYSEKDIDQAIAEFTEAVGDLFRLRTIEHLQARIAARKAAHKSTVILQHKLCELRAKQIRRELLA